MHTDPLPEMENSINNKDIRINILHRDSIKLHGGNSGTAD